uniref:Uncharacterized protein n=1 Tax=Kuenenia stuttgartiensis TaxID=174633 RepID=Q1PYU1_KUEST|nr:unknown protein [Candidatus Kuenenia stuttgartiensis]
MSHEPYEILNSKFALVQSLPAWERAFLMAHTKTAPGGNNFYGRQKKDTYYGCCGKGFS